MGKYFKWVSRQRSIIIIIIIIIVIVVFHQRGRTSTVRVHHVLYCT